MVAPENGLPVTVTDSPGAGVGPAGASVAADCLGASVGAAVGSTAGASVGPAAGSVGVVWGTADPKLVEVIVKVTGLELVVT